MNGSETAGVAPVPHDRGPATRTMPSAGREGFVHDEAAAGPARGDQLPVAAPDGSGVLPAASHARQPAAVRLVRRHVPGDGAGAAGDGDVLEALAKLSRDVEEVKSSVQPQAGAGDGETQQGRMAQDIAAIKDSLRETEAFVSIALLPRLNEIVSEKLTVLRHGQASRTRLKRALLVSVVLNVLACGLILAETRTNVVGVYGALATDWIETQFGAALDGLRELAAP